MWTKQDQEDLAHFTREYESKQEARINGLIDKGYTRNGAIAEMQRQDYQAYLAEFPEMQKYAPARGRSSSPALGKLRLGSYKQR